MKYVVHALYMLYFWKRKSVYLVEGSGHMSLFWKKGLVTCSEILESWFSMLLSLPSPFKVNNADKQHDKSVSSSRQMLQH